MILKKVFTFSLALLLIAGCSSVPEKSQIDAPPVNKKLEAAKEKLACVEIYFSRQPLNLGIRVMQRIGLSNPVLRGHSSYPLRQPTETFSWRLVESNL